MQDESADLCSSSKRLERLRLATQSTWAEVAESLGLSESMIYQAKSGKRSLSDKALYRLASAEINAGILPPLLSKIHSHNQENQGADPDSVISEILNSPDWTDDDEAQLAAVMGKDLLGLSLKLKWEVLLSHLTHFIKGVNLSITLQRRILSLVSESACDQTEPGGIKESADLMAEWADELQRLLPALQVQIDAFQFGLERLVDSKDDNEGG